MSKLPTYIQLCCNSYEVRKQGQNRQVRVGSEWINAIDFPNWLLRENRHDEWSELVVLGATKASNAK
jgi:hypothetical protein